MQIKLYYAEILDHSNNPVLTLDYTASSKHAAVIGKQYVDNCPPANTFKVRMHIIDTKTVCHYLNNKRE
jgi:hypothetical protein